uniref:C-type lectin domain-containing protein n=1 Tax=Cyprinus carpio TaxID=7962 RepID=A0A8C1NVY7_CYPCA
MAMLRSLLLLFIVFSMGDADGKRDIYLYKHHSILKTFRCYKFFSQLATWIAAEVKCKLLQDAVEEGQWLWSDGTPYDYSNWCSNEPKTASNFDVSGGPLCKKKKKNLEATRPEKLLRRSKEPY